MGYLKEGPELDVTVVERTLTVDGYDVPIVHARPDGMPKAGVVLHPDIGGLRPLFDDMARRLATHGFRGLHVRAVARPAPKRSDRCRWNSVWRT